MVLYSSCVVRYLCLTMSYPAQQLESSTCRSHFENSFIWNKPKFTFTYIYLHLFTFTLFTFIYIYFTKKNSTLSKKGFKTVNIWHSLLLSLKTIHPLSSSVHSHMSLLPWRTCLLLPWMMCSFKPDAVVRSLVSLGSFLHCHCLFTILHVCWRWLVLLFLVFLFLLPSRPLLSWFTTLAQLTP